MPEVKLGLEAVLTTTCRDHQRQGSDGQLEKAEADASNSGQQWLASYGGNAQRCVHRVHSAQQGRRHCVWPTSGYGAVATRVMLALATLADTEPYL